MGAANTNPEMYIVGSSRTRTVVNIEAPGLTLRSIIDGSAPYKRIDITNTAAESNRAVMVTADHDISVYCVERGTSMDSYLALPTDVLGSEYFVASYHVSERIILVHRGSQFLIVGVRDNTMVDITLTGSLMHEGQMHLRGTTFTVTVNRLQTIHFTSKVDDLTGTHIVSDAPIGVLSGSKCTDVPIGTSYGDHLVEQLPPVNTWGRHFITSPLMTRSSGDVFRVIGSRDDTLVQLRRTDNEVRNVGAGEYWEFEVGSGQSAVITASKPVLVMQYSKGGTSDNTQADPFMMLVPAIEQFPRDPLYFITPLSSSPPLSHHANVIVDCQHTGALYHNMFEVPERSFNRLSQLRQRVGNREYCIAQMQLALGEHMLQHRELDVRFSVVLYGFQPTSDGNTRTIGEVAYGMPVALTLADNTCVSGDSEISYVSQFDVSTQRNSRQAVPGEITRAKFGQGPTIPPFISFPSQPRLPGDVTPPLSPSHSARDEKSGRYLMLAIMIGMFSLVAISFLVVYIIVLKKRIKKLEAERKGYNRIQASSMMVGPDGYIGLDGSQAGDRDYMTLNQPQGLWRLGRIRRVNGEIQRATPRGNINNISSPTQVSSTKNRTSKHCSPPTSLSSTQERNSAIRTLHDLEPSSVHLVRQASTRSQPPCTGRLSNLAPPLRQSSFRETVIPPGRGKMGNAKHAKDKHIALNHVNYNSSNETVPRPSGSHLRRSVSQTETTAHYCGPKSYYSVPKNRPLNLALYDRPPRKRASSVETPVGLPTMGLPTMGLPPMGLPPVGLPSHDLLIPRHDDGYMSMKDPRTSVISHGSSVMSTKDFSSSSPTSGICADFPSSPTSEAPLLDGNKTYASIPDTGDVNHNNANDAAPATPRRNGAADAESIDYTELV